MQTRSVTGKNGPKKPGKPNTPPNRSNSPVRRRANNTSRNGPLYIIVYTGASLRSLHDLAATRFPFVCVDRDTKEFAVSPQYVIDKFKQAHIGTSFALVAAQERGGRYYASGLALGSVLAAPSLSTGAIGGVVNLQLLCAGRNHAKNIDRPSVPGLGTIMIKSFEKFANKVLGAKMVILDSVTNPHTWNFYVKHGYKRVPNACDSDLLPVFERRAAYFKQKGMSNLGTLARNKSKPTLGHYSKAYVAAMQGVYLPNKNKLGNTVFMSKCLSGKPKNLLGVMYDASGWAGYQGADTSTAWEIWENGVRRQATDATAHLFPDTSQIV